MSDSTVHLRDLWEERQAAELSGDQLALLRYRSNLLGADLRITNFGGGNTSSKIELPDPFTSKPVRVLAVKGSGGDLGSIEESGFSLLYLDRLEQLKNLYRGEAFEDEMVSYYPISTFGQNRVAASIDTPLHAFLPFAHVDHLHPDWAIAIAASANGKVKLDEFNEKFHRNIIWLSWRRPGFELALELERAVRGKPACDGALLGSHGLFTWGSTQQECYRNSIRTIDQMGNFIVQHQEKRVPLFGGVDYPPSPDRHAIAASILPTLRGMISSNRRLISHYTDQEDALNFAGSRWAKNLGELGTSCPDHFLRTRICPMFVEWKPGEEGVETLKIRLEAHATKYREQYASYYKEWATPASPRLRDSNPSVVIIPGLGLFGFGKNKKEARITTEFFINAIHVMAGATVLEQGKPEHPYPQARHPALSWDFVSYHNYVALPRSEAFGIEYWALEEAKLQRMPPEAEFSRKIVLVIGGGSGIGREVVLLLARKGAHVVVADLNDGSAKSVAGEAAAIVSADMISHVTVNIGSIESISAAIKHAVLQFGGIDCIINTAAIFPVGTTPNGSPSEAQWNTAFLINVTGNYLLADQIAWVFRDQKSPASMVLTSSANAVVPKSGSEAYDVSKTALNHLIRELAIRFGPLVRVNGIAPATVIAGSAMFPRDRVMQSLRKYGIEFLESESTEDLRTKLAGFYAQRTITHQPILPEDCAKAIVWLAGDESSKTTGHIIPVDGGLQEAFLR
ncbi:MAG: bifunctional rhamnulose-1-phosphate aldolase/short-chain dehydrogenase [Acidobacteriaceae bacterium]|nr:bifunctional rhamnulose-1-phosphate aldolase/short-chain dehydrogenase [Acidobacteriaceae bacterium]MBV9497937.1 bifunctional rhamnulose-1-phosphate aldolase/short-chain dehydrogenase [Acidobacteriaceae bacterium]